jgi:hypothetical protein
MSHEISNPEFNGLEIDKVFETIVAVNVELKEHFDKYLIEEYEIEFSSRLAYLDMAEISRFIVNNIKSRQDHFLKDLFIKIEQILLNCDTEVENLIVVGLFEGIQNIGGIDIDYYSGFDKWLLPTSKLKWDRLIDTWEGPDWRNKKIKG